MGFLTNCNNGCKFNRGTTEAKLDLESNVAVCSYCNEALENVNDFAKTTMKSLGYVIRANKKHGFSFSCLSCKKNVSCVYLKKQIVGDACEIKDCRFNITEEMKSAIIKYREVKYDE